MTEKVYFIHDGGVDDLASILRKQQNQSRQYLLAQWVIGAVLQRDPSLSAKINPLVVMAGTFGVGNIAEPEQDGTAEWNVFWDPQAFKIVFDSDIKIQMVGLEKTHEVPLTPADQNLAAGMYSYRVEMVNT